MQYEPNEPLECHFAPCRIYPFFEYKVNLKFIYWYMEDPKGVVEGKGGLAGVDLGWRPYSQKKRRRW